MNKLLSIVALLALLVPVGMNVRPAATQPAAECSDVTEIPQTECEALVALYNATDGANWTNSTDWLVTDAPCSWYGVACAAGSVSSLSLEGNQLSGVIPPEIGSLTALQFLYLPSNQLSGAIPPEIGNFTALIRLSLYNNQLSGAIPPEIGNLTALQWLELSDNQLSGAIPPEIGNLTALERLNLGSNQLSGSIPPEIGNLTALTSLYLYNNQLSGAIPPEIASLSALTQLDLMLNQLSGNIPPEIGNLTALQMLWLVDNQLIGVVPLEIGNLTALQYLYLSRNQLSGAIPPEIGNLTALQLLDLSRNQLGGTIPPEIGNLTALQTLNLSSNQIDGTIPLSITHLIALYDNWGADLGYNKLVAFDPAVNVFLDAKDPDWADTQTVPPTDLVAFPSGNGVAITWTPIAYTWDWGYYEISYADAFTGTYIVHGTTISKGWSGYTMTDLPAGELYYFRVRTYTAAHWDQKNELWSEYTTPVSATMPVMAIFKSGLSWAEPGETITYTLTVHNVSAITLTDLLITDTLPIGATYLNGGVLVGDEVQWSAGALAPSSSIAVQFAVSATQTITNSFYAVSAAGGYYAVGSQPVVTRAGNFCSLVTEIPQAECEALVALYNSTDGPNWKGGSAYNNWLVSTTPCSGDMFTKWSGVECADGHVTTLSLNGQYLNGPIPPEIGNLAALQQLNLSQNHLIGSIPAEIGNLVALQQLSLYRNQLSGPIPPEIGYLTILESLYLQYNQLSGSIPPQLGNLTALRRLYLGVEAYEFWEHEICLGGNQLSGAIPPEIGNLTALEWMNLCGNQLSGTIPPEIGNLTALIYLDLSDNQLSGAIPSQISNLAMLQVLDLWKNQLTGAIPSEVGNLPALTYLDLSDNQLSGVIPPEIGNLTTLRELLLDRNQLSGEFPTSITNLINLWNLTFDCTLTSSDPVVIAFLMEKAPDTWYQCTSTGNISGFVFAADGSTAITDTLISVHAHGITPGSSSLGTYVSQVDGSYTISGLAPGTYKVQANNNRAPGYVSKYYDNKYSWDLADTIEVVAGQTTSGINFALEPGGTIRGTVLKEGGGVITDVQLYAGAGTETGIWVSVPVSQVDGSYELTGLPDGQYRVEANFHTLGYDHKYYDNVYRWDQATLVPIAGGNTVTGIDFALGPGGGISGHVYAQDGVTPLEGVCINVSSTAPDFNQVAGWGRTGPDGSFSFGGVPVGNVYIRTHASCGGGNPDYLDEWYAEGGSVIDGNAATSVQIVVGQYSSDINFALDLGGSISGYILKVDGMTIITDTLISVHAHGVTPGSSGRGTNVSQADGSYTISGLAPGTYKVQANNNRAPGYVSKYYDDKYSWDLADTIEVVAGQTTSGINFALEPGGGISGHVYAQDGVTPLEGVCLDVYSAAPEYDHLFGWGRTGPDGSFAFGGVPAGNVYVRTYANCNGANLGYLDEWYAVGGSVIDREAATAVQIVAGQSTGDIDFALDLGGSISGAIYNADGSSLLNNVMYGFESTTQQGSYTTWCTGDGVFAASLPFGTYKVFAQGNSEHCGGDPNYKREYWQEKNSWATANVITLTPESPHITGLIFTLEPGGSISGMVTEQATGAPLSGVSVCRWDYDTGFYFSCTSTASDGTYVLAGLSSGHYRIRASQSGYSWQFFSGTTQWDDATRVTVVAGQVTPGINFPMEPGGSISGFVYNSDGTAPLAGIKVEIVRNNGTGWPTCTDANGHYVLDVVPYDVAWRVRAVSSGDNWCGGSQDYVTEYWQEAASWDAATPLTLNVTTPGYSGINFTLDIGGSISGTVYQTDGVTPISNAWINVMDSRFQSVAGGRSQADGSYLVGGLSQGSYYLSVQAEGFGGIYYPNGYDDPGAVLVPVNVPETTPNINFTLSPEATLSGLVYESDGVTPISGAKVSVWPRAGGQVRSAFADSTGAYTVRGLSTGSYVARAEANGFEVEFYLNTYDWSTATSIQVTQPNDTSGITFTLSLPSSPPPLIEKQALEALYNSTNGTQWLNRDGWLVDPNPCNWYGVTCHDGHVIRIRLLFNQLNGVIPAEIGNLTALQQISLHGNLLHGTIPPEIGNLTALTRLFLSNNQLSGDIPSGLGNLTSLEALGLYRNQLTGAIPVELGNLNALQWLYLYDNQLTSVPSEIGNLSALQYFDLFNNPLAGELPSFLTSLNLTRFTFYGTGWCVPPSGDTLAWLSEIPILYGTGYICGQALGSLGGTVTLTDTTPAAGVQVNLYRSVVSDQWQYISGTQTIVDGTYQFVNLGQGIGIDYRVQFVDPDNQVAPQYYTNKPTIGTADVITITPGVPRTGIDAVMALPLPPAATIDPGAGSVVYNPDGTAEITMPAPTPSDVTVTRAVTCTSGSALIPIKVTLLLSTGPQYPMVAVGGALYQATIPAEDLTGNATLSVVATCEDSTTTTTVGYIVLYDPSGIVTNIRTGQPVAGATVTLYQVPGWLPKTGPDDDRPNTCESNLSKPADTAWSQVAPTSLGIIANADVTPTAPRSPYQLTTVDGYYGWDVSEGCWYVVVEAEGYEPLVSPVVGVPPEVTDLNLFLMPAGGFAVYLPLVLRLP